MWTQQNELQMSALLGPALYCIDMNRNDKKYLQPSIQIYIDIFKQSRAVALLSGSPPYSASLCTAVSNIQISRE